MPTTNEEDLSIAITGASSGIGRALAVEFASPKTKLFLCARRQSMLDDTARACEAKGAIVTTETFDITDHDLLKKWIDNVEQENPVGIVILNAGIFGGSPQPGRLEPISIAKEIIDANLTSPVIASLTFVEKMVSRRAGHIVFVSSLAAKTPLADAPTYSATKAALSSFGKALREFLHEYGVKVTIVQPGHVLTKQAEMQQGALPFMLTPEEAAGRIASAIRQGKTEVTFPFFPRFLVFLLGLLPWRLQALINRSLRFQVSNADQEPKSGKQSDRDLVR